MDNQLDDFLDDVKCQDKQAEQKCLRDGHPKQGPGFLPAAKPRIFPYEDDFGDDSGVDQGSAIAEIRNVIIVEQQPLVGGNSAKEKGQIQKDAGEFLAFVDGLLLKSRVLGVVGTHLAATC